MDGNPQNRQGILMIWNPPGQTGQVGYYDMGTLKTDRSKIRWDENPITYRRSL